MEALWRVFRLGGEPPLTRQMLRMIGMPFTLDISRARRRTSATGQLSPGRAASPPWDRKLRAYAREH
jgi:hypothetical protein